MASEVVNTIMQQIDWRELRMAGFTFAIDGENTLILKKATKAMAIVYDVGSDTYVVKKYKRFKQVEERKGLMWEDLKPAIRSHFKLEYVMRGLR